MVMDVSVTNLNRSWCLRIAFVDVLLELHPNSMSIRALTDGVSRLRLDEKKLCILMIDNASVHSAKV
jgi:hypothetical protein